MAVTSDDGQAKGKGEGTYFGHRGEILMNRERTDAESGYKNACIRRRINGRCR